MFSDFTGNETPACVCVCVCVCVLEFGSHRGRVGEPHSVYMMIAIPLLGVCLLITRAMGLPRARVCVCVCVRIVYVRLTFLLLEGTLEL